MTFPGVPLKFIQAYGFQHIQNIIRKLKTSKCDFEYVELMACPAGCLNGGGQLRSPEGRDAATHLELVQNLQKTMALTTQSLPKVDINKLAKSFAEKFPEF